MFDQEITLYRFALGYCQNLVADLTDAQLTTLPAQGGNPPAWILAHLAICTDFAAGLLGLPNVCPPGWHKQFGMGSKPAPGDAYPSRDELLSALVVGHERVETAARAADPQKLQAPNPIARLTAALPTKGDLLAHLMTTHAALHLGQLSVLRRQLGRPPLF